MSNPKRLFFLIGGLLLSAQLAAHHKYLHIFCIEPTPKPKCCEAISDSAGAEAQYYWYTNPGWGVFQPEATYGENYTNYHCPSTQSVNVQMYIWVDIDVLEGHGAFTC